MKDVTIYTTRTCHFCKMTKEFFKEHDVSYEEKDVTEDEKLQDEMIKRSGQMGVPVIFVGDVMIVGFDEDRLRRELGIKK